MDIFSRGSNYDSKAEEKKNIFSRGSNFDSKGEGKKNEYLLKGKQL